MSRIIVMYESGRVWSCEADPVGDGDAGAICAAAGSVELTPAGLVFEPRVLPWESGEWSVPTGVTGEYTSSVPDFYEFGGERLERLDGSMRSERHADKRQYAHASYLLLSQHQLDDAVSITIDGMVAYSREGDVLVAVAGHGGESMTDGRVDDFAVSNRPAAGDMLAGLAHTPFDGVDYEMGA